MKLPNLILILSLLLLDNLFGQTNQTGRLIFPWLLPESQSNIVVTANPEHPIPCPLAYTNLISNTNLFTPAEQKIFTEIVQKYKNVTTNTGPSGTTFTGLEMRQWNINNPPFNIKFPVGCFVYTNSGAHEEIAYYARTLVAMFRTQSGDGYNVQLDRGRLLTYLEYRSGVLDGLSMEGGIFDADHCTEWARFVNGKIVGKFIGWNQGGAIIMQAEFKEPFDFLKYSVGKFDLAWDKVPATQTNSAPSTP
jgi:hypothetical protein